MTMTEMMIMTATTAEAPEETDRSYGGGAGFLVVSA